MWERDIVRFELEGKRRLGVVIEVRGDCVRVAYGTTQDHAAPCELVREDSRQGRAFPLRELTRFYGANTCWEVASDLERGAKPCSWELLNAIRKLVEAHDASLVDQPVQDADHLVHMAKLVSPLDGECQPVTRCGRALPTPWQQEAKGTVIHCVACIAAAILAADE